MERSDDFYIVLPSNSSMSFFPNNTTTNYTTHLPREVKLDGDWDVGLAEIHIPCTVNHIQESEAIIAYAYEKPGESGPSEGGYIFPHGHYESLTELADCINTCILNSPYAAKLVPSTDRKGYRELQYRSMASGYHVLKFSDKVCEIFGFDREVGELSRIMPIGEENQIIKAERPASLARAIPDQLFVYTDICESYIVGDTQASLLRIVSLDSSKYTFGSNIVRQFSPAQFIPLMKHQFQTILIDIRDILGKPVPFQFGSLIVKLHMKKRY